MKANRILAVMQRHAYETRRNFDRVVDMVYWPVLDIIVWGFFTLYLTRGNALAHGSALRPDVVSFLLGAAILWGLFYSFQRDMAVGFLDELWTRNLINLFSTPLTAGEYVTGLICVNFVKASIGVGMASAVAWAAYAFDIFPMLPTFVPYLLNLVLFALAIGIVITGFIFRYTTRVQALAWSFAGLLQPVSCVFYPVSALPRSLRVVAWSLPTTYAFEGMRHVLGGHGFSSELFVRGLALNAFYIVAAIFIFRIVFASAQARGQLVKLE
jgi:ABC-2 type transport system permease protein